MRLDESPPETAPGQMTSVNEVPASVQLMVERAVEFRQGGGGLAQLTTGAIKMDIADSYQTDQLASSCDQPALAVPVWAYRPGIFAA